MRKGAILAGLVTAAVVGNSAQSAEDRNRPKCDFHVFTDTNDHWALTEGTAKRKWLVMNVGDAAILVSGSEITTPGHPEHEELIATGQSTIATMKYGQPQIGLAPADNTMATGHMTSGDNVTDARAAPAATAAPPMSTTAGASSADATSTASTNNTMASDTATAGSAVGASTSAGSSTMAAGEPTPTTKTTVVICRFFERKR